MHNDEGGVCALVQLGSVGDVQRALERSGTLLDGRPAYVSQTWHLSRARPRTGAQARSMSMSSDDVASTDDDDGDDDVLRRTGQRLLAALDDDGRAGGYALFGRRDNDPGAGLWGSGTGSGGRAGGSSNRRRLFDRGTRDELSDSVDSDELNDDTFGDRRSASLAPNVLDTSAPRLPSILSTTALSNEQQFLLGLQKK